MNRSRIVFSGILLSAVLAFFPGVAEGEGLPVPPESAVEVGRRPIDQCGDNYGVYAIIYDPNPMTLAHFIQYGLFESRENSTYFADPVAVEVADDEGVRSYYVLERGIVVKYSHTEIFKKYPRACDLPNISPRERS